MSDGLSAPSASLASDKLTIRQQELRDRQFTHSGLVLKNGISHFWIKVFDDQLLQVVLNQRLHVADRHTW